MRKRWKGLFCLWVAMAVLLFGHLVWAAEYIYLYTAGQAAGMESGQYVGQYSNATFGIELGTSLMEQSSVTEPLEDVLADYDVSGWEIWRIDSCGYLVQNVASLEAEARISLPDYETYLGGDGNKLIFFPQLTEKTTDTPEPEESPEIAINIANHTWSQFFPAGSYDLVFEGEQVAILDTRDHGTEIIFCQYYLARGSESYELSELDDLNWINYEGDIALPVGEQYVLYARVGDAAGNICYASTGGFVVEAAAAETEAPVISGITNGAVYEGDTSFTVTGANLASVTVDGQEVTLTNNSYTIIADNRIHKIVAKNEAGQETTCEITVNQKSESSNTGNEITAGGTFTLTAGVAYTLGAGQWKVSGDNTIYTGGRTFYVTSTGRYTFQQQ